MRIERQSLVGCATRAVVVAAAVVGLAACSSDDAAQAPPPAATTSQPTSTAAATTSLSASTTSTAPAPSTSPATAQTVPAETEVRAAIALAQQSFSDCLVAMPTCDPSTLAVARGGDLLARNVARINEWNAGGYTVRNREQFRFVVESVTVAGARATATVCIADGSDLVEPGAAPDGGDLVIDDSFTSGRESWDMRVDSDGRWKAFDGTTVGPTESSDVCPA